MLAFPGCPGNEAVKQMSVCLLSHIRIIKKFADEILEDSVGFVASKSHCVSNLCPSLMPSVFVKLAFWFGITKL